ncbi:TPA_asm: hypothetical protein G2906_16160 [Salmonella enterica subsp. enterica serovar Senftenberg]|uniref:DUF7666 domain-containing protein n=1 Tax=Salmonella senftenberg TaxID=28150 RepID=A0A725SEH0_SALSE|nr:hypothetical protein [Salmonella enterica]APW05411.1 hypothetical protein SEES3845_007390 [Salmonella enterica subsp. enterica serovar Senftenberg str. ATCC 43845]EBP4212976.1 hypothetical protein [Salmonella enterica subsp. enterica]EDK6522085.1 hypothetical protein [Salmonella enterica subsp. enterica serovar Typhimurium]EEJ7229376.1 hypothetical protein [Salmonella enterica subsp. arizonae]HCZ4767978.1 hypothetical protein [Salmonella enterica subsp. enterica serovar Senftenberg str. CFS
MTKEIVTFKGFNKDLKCRGFQFAIGETFHHDGKVEACGSGFHACECPFDVFSYYPPAESRYAETISFGITDSEEGGDTKIASSSITIKDELTLPQFIQRGIEWIWSKIDKSLEQQIMCGSWSAATNTGNRSAATNTGDWSAATNTGDRSAATNTGYQSAATNTGDRSAAEVSGSQSVAASLGIEGKARASEGGAIVLCYRDEDGELIHIRASKVGENGIMPNTWYQLDKDGEFVECE